MQIRPDQPPVVSVAIPFYNQEKFVRDTLTSVLRQETGYSYEIVVGDDFSTDATRQILKQYVELHPDKIKVILHKSNKGLLLNLKAIFDVCSGKYIALLGGDDLFSDKKKLEKQIKLLEVDPDLGVVHSNGNILAESKDAWVPNGTVHPDGFMDNKAADNYVRLLNGNFVLASSVVFRRELYKKHVDLQEFIDLSFLMEDLPSWLELSRHTKFAYIDEPLVSYRVHTNSLSRPSQLKKRFQFIQSIYKIKFHYIKKYGCPDDLRETLLDKYNFFLLRHSFLLNNKSISKDAFSHFRKKGWRNIPFDIYMYHLASINSFSWGIVKVVHAFKNLIAPGFSLQKAANNQLNEW